MNGSAEVKGRSPLACTPAGVQDTTQVFWFLCLGSTWAQSSQGGPEIYYFLHCLVVCYNYSEEQNYEPLTNNLKLLMCCAESLGCV